MKTETEILTAMRTVEAAHFRTTDDTGANFAALTVWSALRTALGMPAISKDDLPAWNGKAYTMPAGSRLLTNDAHDASLSRNLHALLHVIEQMEKIHGPMLSDDWRDSARAALKLSAT